MAVLCQIHVPGRTREDATALAERVEQRLAAAGGAPPEVLMFVCVHPDGDGFSIDMVFRSADAAVAEIDEHLRADANAAGFELGTPTIVEVWDMALPGAN